MQRQREAARPCLSRNGRSAGLYTKSMEARDAFLGVGDDEPAAAGRHAPRAKPVLCPHTHPTRVRWSCELHHRSKSMQEQVKYAIAAAKSLKAAEALIRPRCALQV